MIQDEVEAAPIVAAFEAAGLVDDAIVDVAPWRADRCEAATRLMTVDRQCGSQGLNGLWTAAGEAVWTAGFFGQMAAWDGTAWDCPSTLTARRDAVLGRQHVRLRGKLRHHRALRCAHDHRRGGLPLTRERRTKLANGVPAR